MIRHCLIAALRNMAASKLLSVISILGLAIGFAGAFLMTVVLRNELTYEHFLPGYDRTYVLMSHDLIYVDRHTSHSDHRMADLLRLNLPGIERAASVAESRRTLKRGMIAEKERIVWADPDIFSILPFPALHGDLASALRRPDGIVLTRAMAQKYFSQDDVVGQGIDLDGHPMIVRAVIENPPLHATRFTDQIYISTRASFFAWTAPDEKNRFHLDATVYARLKPGADVADINMHVPAIYNRLAPHTAFAPPGQNALLMRIDRAHLLDELNPGITAKLAVGSASALLLLFIAVANFVNLAAARASRRQREVGVRKACGASRNDLIRQFMGEALVPVALAGLIAPALVEAVLPAANAFLQTAATFTYWRDALLALGLLLGIVTVGVVAGAYPAFILSSFRPAIVLKGWIGNIGRPDVVRNLLVAIQFAILVVLTIAAAVVYQQRDFATRDAIRAEIDQMLIVKGGCKPALVDAIRDLSGVRGAACSNDMLLDSLVIEAHPYKGKTQFLYKASADPRIFALYGIKPIAGSLPADDGHAPGLVINQGVVGQLGFASPNAALGQIIWTEGPMKGLRITAVVRDFSFHSVEWPPTPTIFTPCDAKNSDTQCKDLLHVRLSGRQIPETLDAIDHLWKANGSGGDPINRFFLDEHLQARYIDLLHQAEMFALFAGIAVLLACLGLVGIAVSTAERRTKEIGVRKAAGATDGNIVAMLLWQFAQPVLWANVMAWPLAWWLMNRWLTGFSAHVELHAWLFVAASAIALAVALLTVAGQALLVARRKPVLALRYE